MDEKSLKVYSTERRMDDVKEVVAESGRAIFSLLMQLTHGDAKNMLMAHARKEMRNGFYSMLEFNKTWDPQARTGKLAALVDLVTLCLWITRIGSWEN